MGCDIHAVVDYETVPNGRKWNFAALDLNRNYTLFSHLAGVRNYCEPIIVPIAEPRGCPDNACDYFKDLLDGWNGDAHSTSWVTLAELETIATQMESEELLAVIGLMQPMEKAGLNPRLLFFFDN